MVAQAATGLTIQIPVFTDRVCEARAFFCQPNRDNPAYPFGTIHIRALHMRRSPVTRAILRVLAALAIVSAFGLAPAAAQTGQTFGELVGKVTDDQGGVLPGVTVTLTGPNVMGT